ncbi:hypothetical protein T265_00944 [Opisthorchis viverrini]|uniref:Uncharacterized protein n=1 Tax=Opisthorchis viverrini TaxID=6198 RepID=A0A074ZZZ3_OPIVI|nr:hypothetical protein T265_00944 [Opisthorchis viverrini]KER33033.1 hypothetical protein T265_00944 [Opisthorchis viverrini]
MEETDCLLSSQRSSVSDMPNNIPHTSQDSDSSLARNDPCTNTEGNSDPTPIKVLQHITPNRRKRIRISPLSRSGTTLKNDSSSTMNGPDEVIQSDHVSTADFHCPNRLDHSERDRTDTLRNSVVNLSAIEPEVRGIIFKYVQSESVICCLELAGFTSPYVLTCLDETQIHRVEDFVGHACTLMNSASVRERFIGPIFSDFPEQFRFPSGTVCGLLLATAEIKRRYSSLSKPNESYLVDHNTKNLTDVSAQTDISLPFASSLSTAGEANYSNKLSNAIIKSSPPTQGAGSPQSAASTSSAVIEFPSTLDSASKSNTENVATSSDPMSMMAAAFQAAAVAAAGNNHTIQPALGSKSTTADSSTGTSGEQISNPLELAQALGNQFPVEITSAARLVAAVSGCAFSNPFQPSQTTLGPGVNYDEEVVDLDRLKQHSSASAIRLASRQFLNAHLVRGRDFDMEMEISTTPEGVKRVTGIFYCHLCREKRERTSAVRFSIARNRYPVLSNVLSHLKTHFQYRGQFFTGTGTTITGTSSNMHHLTPSTKVSTGFGDVMLPMVSSSIPGLPFVGSTTLPNFGLNAPSYFDVNVTPSGASNTHTSRSTVSTPTPPDPNIPAFMLKGEELEHTRDDEQKRQILTSANSVCQSPCDARANHSNATSLESSDSVPTSTFNQIVDHFSSQADFAPLGNPR